MPCEVNGKQCLTWDEGEICFSNNPYCWDEVCLAEEIEEIVSGGEATSWLGAYEKLDEPKKKRFITLIAKVDGITNKQTKEVKEVKINSKNIEFTVKEVLKSVRVKK